MTKRYQSVCSSSMYGFWLPLWYILAIVLSVLLRCTDSDYPFGIFWPLYCLFFFDVRILITSLWYLQTLLPLVVYASRPFLISWLITRFVSELTRRLPLLEQELPTLPEHMSSPPVFSGVRVTWSLVLCVCFVDRCLSFCTFFLLAIVLTYSFIQIFTGDYKTWTIYLEMEYGIWF
jgi:hypothetical protein